MNERIRELSSIAKNLATDEAIHLSRVHNRTLSLDEEQEIITKKFAELIVRECALVVHKKTGPKSALNVLEHFGVEE